MVVCKAINDFNRKLISKNELKYIKTGRMLQTKLIHKICNDLSFDMSTNNNIEHAKQITEYWSTDNEKYQVRIFDSSFDNIIFQYPEKYDNQLIISLYKVNDHFHSINPAKLAGFTISSY